ncbi:MAG: hypothetical protein LBL52_02120 [Rickettsiales bacterium]|jgi:predicted outer membrane repeat protein|nr:hypothetical protein [Rickettsiales bacterium]
MTIVGTPIDSAGNYGIAISDYLNTLGSSMSMTSYGGTPDGTALILGPYTLVFAPGWGNDISVDISNLSIYGATNGAVAFHGDGTGTHNYSLSGTYFYGNSTGSNGGAVSAQAQVASLAPNRYILTDDDFSSNSAASGGAVYMVSNNAQYSDSSIPIEFSVIDSSGTSTHYIAFNRAMAGNGGGIYFMANNAGGSSVKNAFTATGNHYYANSATGLGGAIYNGVMNGNNPAVNDFNITGGDFAQNQAASGGAIATQINGGNTDNNINISGTFQSNSATTYGGAIYNAVGDQFSPYGGAINFNISGNFNGNKAANGGAIYNNTLAGQSNVSTTVSGQFTNNSASANGGAIYNIASSFGSDSPTLTILDGTNFYSNGATYGGAIYNFGNGIINLETGITGINFTNNYAAGAEYGADIYQDSISAVINITGNGSLNISDGIGGVGTINQASGTMLGLWAPSQSFGFIGTYNLAAGATLNAQGVMFGGTNNIGGVANITSGQNSFYFNANMLSGAQMNFTSTSTGAVSIGAADSVWAPGISFAGAGANIKFNENAPGAYYLLSKDIANGQSNTIDFFGANVSLGSTQFTGGTGYGFLSANGVGSTIDLANSSSNYLDYVFGNLATDSNALLSFKVGNDLGINTLSSDTINVLGGAGGTVGLGNIYINDANGLIDGYKQIIYGNALDFAQGSVQHVATGNGAYEITTTADGKYVLFSGLYAGSGPGGGGGGGDSQTGVVTLPGTDGTFELSTNGDGSGSTTITPPTGGGEITVNPPDGGDITVTLPSGGSGAITLPGTSGQFDISNGSGGEITVNPPDGGGAITIPPGGSEVITLPGGEDITFTVPGSGGAVTLPGGGDTTFTVPDGGNVVITTPPGGGSGVITLPGTSGDFEISTSTDPDGSVSGAVTLPGGSGSWNIITPPGGGGGTVISPPAGSRSITLNDVNAISSGVVNIFSSTTPRAFQISTSAPYYNDANLDEMAAGTFSVYGAEAGKRTAVLSGLKQGDPSTRQSLFNIGTNSASFALADMTIQDAATSGSGSVLSINDASSTAMLQNLSVKNNTASDNGGAINALAGTVASINVDYDNNSATGGNGGAIYNSTSTSVLAGSFTNNTASGDGGAIYNAAGGNLGIYAGSGTMNFAGNNSGGDGGAIYNAGTLTLAAAPGANILFSGNYSLDPLPNDIYTSGTFNFASTGGMITFGGGISGTGDINKNGLATLILAPGSDSSGFTGAFNQSNGIVDVYGAFFGGTSTIEGGVLNWNAGAVKPANSILNATGGAINIYGNLRLENEYDLIGSNAILNMYKGDSLEIAGGTVYISPNSTLIAPDGSYGYANMTDGHLVIAGQGIYVYSGGYEQSGGVIHLENNALGFLNPARASGGIYGGDMAITNATLLVQGVDLNVGVGDGSIIPTSGSLAVGDNAMLSTIDGALQTHMFAGDFALFSALPGSSQTLANFAVDVDAQSGTADLLKFAGTAAPGATVIHGSVPGGVADITAMAGTVMLADLNFVKAPIDKTVDFRIMEAPSFDPSITFAAVGKEFKTPIGNYTLSSLGEGEYELSFNDQFNPTIERGGASKIANFVGQIFAIGEILDHTYTDGIIEKSSEDACDCLLGLESFETEVGSGGEWAKVYGLSSKWNMSQGVGLSGSLYGAAAGYDFDVRHMGSGFNFIPGAYVAYTGGSYDYDEASIRQNGLQAGVIGTVEKGGFLASGMMFGGVYGNDMHIGGEHDHTTDLFGGAALKGAYNFAHRRFVAQPSVLAAYVSYGSKEWHSDYGDMDITAGSLDGASVVPSLSAVYLAEGGWNARAKGLYVMNYGLGVNGRAGNIALPQERMDGSYMEYSLGAAREYGKDSLLSFDLIALDGEAARGWGGKIGFTTRDLK